MIRLHAILSLSGAHIWTRCAPSARFQEQIPEENSVFSEEGTLAHGFASIILDGWVGNAVAPAAYGTKYHEAYAWYVANMPEEDPADMVSQMINYAEDFARYVYEIGGVILVEQRLDLGRFIPLSWGTGDGINLFPDIIYINDFKFGKGQRIYADDNDQLKGYALGAYLHAVELGYDPHTVIMTIVQPRMSSEPSVAQISVTELLDWAANVVAPMAELAIAGQGAFVPGNHCLFCKARTSCAAFYTIAAEAWGLQDLRVMTDEQRAFILEYGEILTKWINAVKADTVKRMRNRERVPGFKLIATKGDRKLTNDVAVAQTLINMGYLPEQIYTQPGLKPITSLENLFKPKRLFTEAVGEYIFKPDGNPKLVKEDHVSPAICEAAADIYDAPDLSQQ